MRNALALNSNNIEVNRTKKSLLKKKKKGFTLVELIAVIAILAILAAIIVPRVANYTTSANDAKHLANAKTLANAIEAYNADNPTTSIDDKVDLSADTQKNKLMSDYIQTWPNDFDTITPQGSDSTKAPAKSYAALREYIQSNTKN
ncbi:fimbrial protein [Clostridium pasteurianum DSM 525 = ATCC 6013]|uniref:Fimbrial protein n=1 Tax=Clostridium pasteurianum DSM 525 = ATCC 6013 TaxID=1262449 RepID=A0A0H3J121_CLOPA|nr:prepilin-type N-terminal cleavage/methylation domain-containing protein [Clostridium pasteurianum]AJA47556.1 fimbrial protein [Clostridium pasteurianum DSM 525 = ATCC 6013]AJA51544.1 fimbrial protein [Clostridium pasteurianum DSM 525 = ATCC 6013]AOZ74871.1 hypothetical protein AQ983_07155 [Clostridium pasteurianum DSM 525 = ATCC 6013]AOZ78666.1 hypothetical protein AQ984_07145 [Clostridium pasteurianum]ELP58103.1 fimbrial protein [Clostridium pasteurianum DSM 525 = ATCC 6013]